MKPPVFEYLCPASLDEAVGLLARHGGDAKLLAGGQSLMPLLNFRMLRPGVLIDLNRIGELDFVTEGETGLRIGALTRHHTLETSPLVKARVPVLHEATQHVAHLAIRNRGTIGGSLAHADPAAELPMLAVLLDAEITTACAAGGLRHPAGDFFVGPLTTALRDDEIVTEIAFSPLPPQTGWGFEEVSLRHGDFAIAAVAATLSLEDGVVSDARLAAMGVGETPLRLRAVERRLTGQPASRQAFAAAARLARDFVQPNSDLRGSADYRRHLVAALTERVLSAASERVG